MAWKLYYPNYKSHIMKSRIFKALIAIIAPLAIEYVVRRISEKLDKKQKQDKQIPVANLE